jgi:hypothetical protein
MQRCSGHRARPKGYYDADAMTDLLEYNLPALGTGLLDVTHQPSRQANGR